MIGKYKEKQEERNIAYKEKQECLQTISSFLETLGDVEGIDIIKNTVEKLSELQNKECLKTENQYMQEIAAYTEVSVSTLNRIKHEGSLNEGVWDTPGKKRPHMKTVSNLDSFDMIWSTVKRLIAKKIALSTADTEKLIEEPFASITASDLKTMIDYVIKVEDKYRERDNVQNNLINEFIISVGSDNDSSSSEEYFYDFLESDVDYSE